MKFEDLTKEEQEIVRELQIAMGIMLDEKPSNEDEI